MKLCPVVTACKVLRSEVLAPLCARLLERPEGDLHHCPTKKGFTVALSVLIRELTVTRLLIGWKITSPILDRAVSYVAHVVDWTGITSLLLVW